MSLFGWNPDQSHIRGVMITTLYPHPEMYFQIFGASGSEFRSNKKKNHNTCVMNMIPGMDQDPELNFQPLGNSESGKSGIVTPMLCITISNDLLLSLSLQADVPLVRAGSAGVHRHAVRAARGQVGRGEGAARVPPAAVREDGRGGGARPGAHTRAQQGGALGEGREAACPLIWPAS